jgi:tRNA G37 N-methylase TrmD
MPLASTNLTPFYSISKVLHTPASTQTNLYTNQLLHKPAFTQTSSYTDQLLDKPHFTQTTFYTNQLYTTLALSL